MDYTPKYFTILPSKVRLNNNLSPGARLLFSEIFSLQNKGGVCYAGNRYWQKLFNVSRRTVQRWISELIKEQIVTVDVIEINSQKIDRLIRLNNNFKGDKIVTIISNSIYNNINSILGDKNVTPLTYDQARQFFPNYYSKEFEMKIKDHPQVSIFYHRHLLNLGMKKVLTPSGIKFVESKAG